MVSRKAWVTFLLSFLVIAPYVLALVSMWIGFFGDTWTSFQGKAYALVAASMGASVLGDTLIALTLVYYLHSKHTASSVRVVTHLLAYVVGMSVLTSMFLVIQLICILAFLKTLLYVEQIKYKCWYYVTDTQHLF
ncbi:hypothetical protein J3A83DRAFT_4236527 [Scleroderma citrinum]